MFIFNIILFLFDLIPCVNYTLPRYLWWFIMLVSVGECRGAVEESPGVHQQHPRAQLHDSDHHHDVWGPQQGIIWLLDVTACPTVQKSDILIVRINMIYVWFTNFRFLLSMGIYYGNLGTYSLLISLWYCLMYFYCKAFVYIVEFSFIKATLDLEIVHLHVPIVC